MVTETSSQPHPAGWAAQGDPSLRKWPLVAIQLALLFSGLSRTFWEDPWDPPFAAAFRTPSPLPRPWRPRDPAKNGVKHRYRAENGAVYLVWTLSSQSLSRRECGQAEGVLPTSGVQ